MALDGLTYMSLKQAIALKFSTEVEGRANL